jgi:hypothetical protein
MMERTAKLYKLYAELTVVKKGVELHFTTGMDLVCYQGVPVN